eukprot:scaffold60245_cov75-Cyclotella_meneghiniana.AAC.1
MKLSVAITAILFVGSSAFAPSALTRTLSATSQTVLFSEPKEEEGGLDLDLEEMFDAADKGQDFDKAIKDVKKEKKD